jgi:hypothetical protein
MLRDAATHVSLCACGVRCPETDKESSAFGFRY